ncbi:hypothetical protein Patl1_06811 [Pistacia atlantica]|uniref:Uncharacterized protein n=1 Tax=Pistacia atlantica TaxID=434234 RepID=A0ACC1AJ60_9ROSI|nr:hypothetical protein Patl1_06811 [Pistacia atlantica]
MSLLLNHPLVLKRARAELDRHVGHGRLAEEPDFVKLPYLQRIINETLWLYPKVWEDPKSSRPERFEGLEGEVEAYNFIPFGRERRSCPGASLANRVMGLALATLIQCFEWERISEE